MFKKLFLLLTGCLLFTNQFSSAEPSKKSKAKYIGDYQFMPNVYRDSDTLSGMLYLTQDSFAVIYQVRAKGDHALPLFQGTWTLVDDTLIELRRGDIITKGIFQMTEYGNHLIIDSTQFFQNGSQRK